MIEDRRMAVQARLVARMAATTQADLSATDPGFVLQRCCSCGNVASCEDWLDDHAEGADKAPRFCQNADVMFRPDDGAIA